MRVSTMDITPKDLAVARRFLDCCYDDALPMPSRTSMLRLVELGLVEEIKPRTYAETMRLRNLIEQ
jgi:hypothetical protein